MLMDNEFSRFNEEYSLQRCTMSSTVATSGIMDTIIQESTSSGVFDGFTCSKSLSDENRLNEELFGFTEPVQFPLASEKAIEGTDDVSIVGSLSFSEMSASNSVSQVFLVDRSDPNNEQRMGSCILKEDWNPCDDGAYDDSLCKNDPTPIDLVINNCDSSTDGDITRINSMESLINGLMTWTSNDAPLTLDL
jgi:hypothetical protein